MPTPTFETATITSNLPVLPAHVLQIIQSLTQFNQTYSTVAFYRQGRTAFGNSSFQSAAQVEISSLSGNNPLTIYSGQNNTIEALTVNSAGATKIYNAEATTLSGSTLVVNGTSTLSGSTTANVGTSTFIVKSATYPGNLVTATNGGLVVIGDYSSNVNGTNVRVDDSAQTVIITAVNGTTFNGSIIGNLAGTASYATYAAQAGTASYVNRLNQNVVITGSETINLTNTDYVNANGANSHILLTNPSSTGQNSVTSIINGNLAGKWRTDYLGGNTYVSSGSQGYHAFYLGGDYLTGSIKMIVGYDSVQISGSLGVTGSVAAASFTGSLLGTATNAITASYALLSGGTITNAISASYATTALTASYAANAGNTNVTLVAGPGISVNGYSITASLRTVNGISPINGNATVTLTGVYTGYSASFNAGPNLMASSSGNITSSFITGSIWVVSGETGSLTSGSNGRVYVFTKSGSNQVGLWSQVAPLDTAAADARYLMLSPQSALAGPLNLGTQNLTNGGTITATTFAGTASWASNAVTASYVTGSKVYGPNGSNSVLTASYAVTASYAANVTAPTIGTSGSTIYSTNPVTNNFNTTGSLFLGLNAGSASLSAKHSTFIGENAGFNANSAYYSIFIGSGSGQGAQFANNANFLGAQAGSGSVNSANSNYIGTQAGASIPNAGYDNNFIGNTAGFKANFTAQSNYIGKEAGYSGSSNVNANFIGYQAGYSTTGSQYTIGIGDNAAGNANGSTYAVAVGYQAGQYSNKVYQATMVGAQAGYDARLSTYTTFIGAIAGSGAYNTLYSTFVGFQAGQGAFDNNSGIFIGNTAGYQARNASYSTLIGTRVGLVTSADYNAGLLGVGNNNIIIGTNITLPEATANAINLGGVLFGSGSYATPTGNPYSGSVGNGKIGINVVTPVYNLDVSGSGNFTNGLAVTGSITAMSASISGDVITNISDTYSSTAAVTKIVTLTSAQYTSLSPNYDANTLYVVI